MKKNDLKWAVVLILPALILYISLVWIPTGLGAYESLFRWKGAAEKWYIGLGNYIYLFSNRIFRNSLWVTLKYMLINVPIQIPTAYFIAYLLYSGVKGYKIFRFIFFVPVVMLTVAVGISFNYLLSSAFGIFETLYEIFGLEYSNPLANRKTALFTAVLADWWKWLGVKIMLFYAGFQNMPGDVLEAAHIDGASKFKIFFKVVLPLSLESISLVTTLLVIGSLKVFDLLYVMTAGGPNHSTSVITIFLIDTTFGEQNFGSGSAIAVVMFISSLALTVFMRKIFGILSKKY